MIKLNMSHKSHPATNSGKNFRNREESIVGYETFNFQFHDPPKQVTAFVDLTDIKQELEEELEANEFTLNLETDADPDTDTETDSNPNYTVDATIMRNRSQEYINQEFQAGSKRSRVRNSKNRSDSWYIERRKKNNEAARRSREAKRVRMETLSQRVLQLEEENQKLKLALLHRCKHCYEEIAYLNHV